MLKALSFHGEIWQDCSSCKCGINKLLNHSHQVNSKYALIDGCHTFKLKAMTSARRLLLRPQLPANPPSKCDVMARFLCNSS